MLQMESKDENGACSDLAEDCSHDSVATARDLTKDDEGGVNEAGEDLQRHAGHAGKDPRTPASKDPQFPACELDPPITSPAGDVPSPDDHPQTPSTFDITQWFTGLELHFREVVDECADQLTEKQNYLDGCDVLDSVFRWNDFLRGKISSPLVEVEDSSSRITRRRSSLWGWSIAPIFPGNNAQPELSQSPPGVGPASMITPVPDPLGLLSSKNTAGFGAFAFSHAILETSLENKQDGDPRKVVSRRICSKQDRKQAL